MPLAQFSAGFQSFPPLPTSELGSPGADSRVGGFVYILGPCGSLQPTLLWIWEFLLLPQPLQIFIVRNFEAFFSLCWNPGFVVCLAPQLPSCSSRFICMQIWNHRSSSHCLAVHLLHPSCPSLPLLPVWVNVSFLTPWLSDVHTVRFSGSSVYFLFLNLLSFFWFCKEALCIYLSLHLGWKS